MMTFNVTSGLKDHLPSWGGISRGPVQNGRIITLLKTRWWQVKGLNSLLRPCEALPTSLEPHHAALFPSFSVAQLQWAPFSLKRNLISLCSTCFSRIEYFACTGLHLNITSLFRHSVLNLYSMPATRCWRHEGKQRPKKPHTCLRSARDTIRHKPCAERYEGEPNGAPRT